MFFARFFPLLSTSSSFASRLCFNYFSLGICLNKTFFFCEKKCANYFGTQPPIASEWMRVSSRKKKSMRSFVLFRSFSMYMYMCVCNGQWPPAKFAIRRQQKKCINLQIGCSWAVCAYGKRANQYFANVCANLCFLCVRKKIFRQFNANSVVYRRWTAFVLYHISARLYPNIARAYVCIINIVGRARRCARSRLRSPDHILAESFIQKLFRLAFFISVAISHSYSNVWLCESFERPWIWSSLLFFILLFVFIYIVLSVAR